MKIYYMCDFCNKFFDNIKDCMEHEKHGHIRAVRILKQESDQNVVNCEATNGLRYPNVLHVELNPGRNGIYILNRLEDEPEDEPDDEPKVKK